VIRPALREVRAARPQARIVPLDIFVAVNLALFGAMCVFTYYARFVHYRGAANVHEFFLYATVLVAGVVLLWRSFRGYRFGAGLLLLVQAGILAHFAGAFVQWDGRRLYDFSIAGLRYDKYVHFANAFIAVRVVGHIVERHGVRIDGLVSLLLGMTVLGLGAVVEIVEYLVVRTVPGNGVGGYDNNMQDLIANALGTGVSVLLARRRAVPLHAAEGFATRAHRRALRSMRLFSILELGAALAALVAVLWFGPAVLPRAVFPWVATVLLAFGLLYAAWISPVLMHGDSLAARGLGTRHTWYVRTDNLRDAVRPFTMLTLAGAVALLLLASWWNPGWVARADWRAWGVRLLFYVVSAHLQALVLVGFVLVRLRTIFSSRGAVAVAAGALFAVAHAPNPTVMGLTATFAASAAWLSVRTPNVVVMAASQTVLGLLLHRALEEPLRVGYFYAHPDVHVFREALPLVARVIGGLY
jgi:putative membrane protein